MLDLIGRVADGWLPSLPYLRAVSRGYLTLNAMIDEGAAHAGRDPGRYGACLISPASSPGPVLAC